MNSLHFQNHELLLRPLVDTDVAIIESWPDYPDEFNELDYALRKDGWLAEFSHRPGTWIYAVEVNGNLVAFTIFATTAPSEAEFRIALRADMLGQGLGKIITMNTLAEGFCECGLLRIHLIVRKNNRRAIKLYQRLGFTHQGECRKTVNNQPTDFLLMDLLRQEWLKR